MEDGVADVTYIIGSAEDAEAEFGVADLGPFVAIQFFRGEIAQAFPCSSLAEARQIATDDGCSASVL
jgi:hypothetical protein